MELEFLQIGEYTCVTNYIQHIKELINIKLVKGDTYNNLFNKLDKLFDNNQKKKEAIKSWIQLNKEEQEDQNVFDTVLVNEREAYAAFNLR